MDDEYLKSLALSQLAQATTPAVTTTTTTTITTTVSPVLTARSSMDQQIASLASELQEEEDELSKALALARDLESDIGEMDLSGIPGLEDLMSQLPAEPKASSDMPPPDIDPSVARALLWVPPTVPDPKLKFGPIEDYEDRIRERQADEYLKSKAAARVRKRLEAAEYKAGRERLRLMRYRSGTALRGDQVSPREAKLVERINKLPKYQRDFYMDYMVHEPYWIVDRLDELEMYPLHHPARDVMYETHRANIFYNYPYFPSYSFANPYVPSYSSAGQ